MNTPLTDEQQKTVEDNLGLAYAIARDMKECKLDHSDRRQAGVVGLMKAVQNFNPDLGIQLSTYARNWIINEIRKAELRDKTIWVPIHQLFECRHERSVAARDKYGQKAKEAAKMSSFSTRQFDMAVVNDDPSERLAEKDRINAIKEAIESLDGLDREMIELRMYHQMSMRKIGEKLGMGRETARNTINSIINKLKWHPAIRRVA